MILFLNHLFDAINIVNQTLTQKTAQIQFGAA
jgi:hypothetical protein